MKKRRERSLKQRINNSITSLNFYSLLVVMAALVITLGFCIMSFGEMISVNAANQISTQFNRYLVDPSKKQEAATNTEKQSTLSEEDVFKGIGFSYTFLPDAAEKLKMKKGIQINVPSQNENSMLTIEYTILKGNTVLYDSQPNDFFNSGIIGKLLDKVNETTESTVTDSNGVEIYKVRVKLNPFIIFVLYLGMISICFVIFLITMIISKVVGRMLASIIVKPLSDLDKRMNELSNGNIEAAMVTEISFKKPVVEVERLAGFTNAIMAKMNEYAKKLANQNAELEAQNNMLNDNGKILENMNHDLDEKNLKLKNIFDNVEQGFLSFNKDLLIHSEYSQQCEKLFSRSLLNEKLSSLIYPEDLNMKNFMDELFEKIFEENEMRREIYFPLLPEEININDCIVKIDYKMVKNEKKEDNLIVIITDITEKRLLEKQRDLESNILKMVVKAIINRDEFADLVKSYNIFSNHNFKKLSKEKYDDILRQIHTYKGNFSQYEMVNLVPRLNELEDKLYDSNVKLGVAEINSFELKSWIKEDLDIIELYAGKDIFKHKEVFHIDKEKLLEIEAKIKETLEPNEANVILPMIKSLSYKSVKDMLRTYPDYTIKLSERLEKNISPFTITGDDVMVDYEYLNDAFKAIIHIFRNAVDHGIEAEDERMEMGKELIGKISCKIEDFKEKFKIIISDDGRGIDTKAIEEEILKNGIYTENEIENMSQKQIINLIFEKGITTKESSNYISGRGIGMSALKEKIEEINGSIEVESGSNKGTVFTLTLPKQIIGDNIAASAKEFMKNLRETAEEILNTHMGISLNRCVTQYNKTIKLREFTALLSLKGSLNAVVLMSVNESMAKKLVSGFMIEKIDENDIINYIEDVLAEVANTILGATFGKYHDTNTYFQISIPAVLSKNGGYIKQTQADILTCNLCIDEYEFDISILLANDEIKFG